MDFEQRAESMGLTNRGNGCFHYQDQYGEVVYNQLRTKDGSELLDNVDVPYFGLFTKGQNNQEFTFAGVLSRLYEFIGNDHINEKIRQFILQSGNAILREYTMLSPKLTQMYNEIVIQNPTNHPSIGDIYPQLIITNSYDGTKTVNVSFGICMHEGSSKRIGFGFRTKIGSMRQVHIRNSQTKMISAVANYVNVFSGNILTLIQNNFNSNLSIDDVMSTLELIEKVGKKRRHEITEFLSNIINQDLSDETQQLDNINISTWNLFLSIVKYSTKEKNLNAKLLLEDIAERVLIVPEQMTSLVT